MLLAALPFAIPVLIRYLFPTYISLYLLHSKVSLATVIPCGYLLLCNKWPQDQRLKVYLLSLSAFVTEKVGVASLDSLAQAV